MKNSHAMVGLHWRQKQQQAEARYIENTQLHEDNQLEKEHPTYVMKSKKREVNIFSVAIE